MISPGRLEMFRYSRGGDTCLHPVSKTKNLMPNIRYIILNLIFSMTLICAGSTVTAADPSVLLITIDTLRADRLGSYGDAHSSTPFLDRLSRHAVVYTDAWTDVPLTLPAHTSLLTGQPVTRHGITGNGHPVGSENLLLPEILKAQGYSTAAVIGGYPLVRKFGLSRGFQMYDDRLKSVNRTGVPERSGAAVASASIDLLESLKAPVFLWVHFYDPHAPYDPPDPYRNVCKDLYRSEVAYTDRCVELLMQAWTEKFGSETFRIIVADHGESLGDHNEITHGVFLYQETVGVPLLVLPPAGSGPVVGLSESSVPIHAIFDWILVKRVPSPGLGSPEHARVIYTRYPFDRYHWSPLTAIRRGPWKYIHGPDPELYNLDSDPGETLNVLTTNARIVEFMTREIYSVKIPKPETGRAVTTETRMMLESLGYVAPSGHAEMASLPDPKGLAPALAPLERALNAVDHGLWQDALPDLERTLTIDPDNPVANNNMGLVLVRLNRGDQAIPFLKRALEIKPGDVQVMSNLGVAYRRTGKTADAVTMLRAALTETPDFTGARINLVLALYTLGKLDEAQQILQMGTEYDPEIVNHPAVKTLFRE